MGRTYHATASSAIFASHVTAGLTIPGLKKVPMPGCEADQPRWNVQSTRRQTVLDSETDLVVDDLFERIALVE